jgi:hypothetical protein
MVSIRAISAFIAVLATGSIVWALGPEIKKKPQPDNSVDDVRPWLLGLTKKIQPKDLDPKLLKELMEKMEKLPKDQKPDPKEIEKLVNDNPRFKDPEFLKQLEKLVNDKDFPKQLDQKLPDNQKLPPNVDEKDLHEKLEQVIETGKKPIEFPKDVNPPKVDPQNLEPPKDPTNSDLAKSAAADNEWVKWAEKNFGNSPATEGAVKDLISALEKNNGKGMFDDIPEFKDGAWKDVNNWSKSNTGDLKLKPPDNQGPKFNSPNTGNSGGGSSWGGGGSSSWGSGGGGAGGSGFGGGGTALAVIAGIAAAIFLAILLFRKWKFIQEQRAAMIHTGKSGIDFDSIRSRDELVRVFNAVSLDQCGEDARPWNHRVIADEFGRTRPTVAEPADQVAGLYERARYAPTDEDLTHNEFADARRDLRLLAGAPA